MMLLKSLFVVTTTLVIACMGMAQAAPLSNEAIASMLPPGGKIIPGDPKKNEFFIIAGTAAPQPKVADELFTVPIQEKAAVPSPPVKLTQGAPVETIKEEKEISKLSAALYRAANKAEDRKLIQQVKMEQINPSKAALNKQELSKLHVALKAALTKPEEHNTALAVVKIVNQPYVEANNTLPELRAPAPVIKKEVQVAVVKKNVSKPKRSVVLAQVKTTTPAKIKVHRNVARLPHANKQMVSKNKPAKVSVAIQHAQPIRMLKKKVAKMAPSKSKNHPKLVGQTAHAKVKVAAHLKTYKAYIKTPTKVVAKVKTQHAHANTVKKVASKKLATRINVLLKNSQHKMASKKSVAKVALTAKRGKHKTVVRT